MTNNAYDNWHNDSLGRLVERETCPFCNEEKDPGAMHTQKSGVRACIHCINRAHKIALSYMTGAVGEEWGVNGGN